MKKFSRIIIVIFLNLMVYFNYYGISFDNYESEMNEKYKFVENGVKLCYKTNNSKEEEKEKILKVINKQYDGYIDIMQDKIVFDNVIVKFINNLSYLNVEISIVNTNAQSSTKEILSNIKKIKKTFNWSEYKYFKVKVDDSDKLKKQFERIIREKFLDISNGYIAQITDKSMQQISIAICKYDTGDFLLMATPVIYTSF